MFSDELLKTLAEDVGVSEQWAYTASFQIKIKTLQYLRNVILFTALKLLKVNIRQVQAGKPAFDGKNPS